MRKVSFKWAGADLEFTPSMTFLASLASDIARISEGTENTLSLAHKINAGGADPVFAATALWHMLKAASVEGITREDAYTQLMGDSTSMAEKVEFRTAYLQSVLPQIDYGKKPPAPDASKPTAKSSRRK